MPETHFAHVLRERIRDYFSERGLSPQGDRYMAAKIMLGVGAWLSGLALLFGGNLRGWHVPLVYVALALPQTFLILNVAHDSIHGAVSRRRWVNRVLALIYDGCGVNSYLVRILHNQRHHFCINLLGEDDPLGGRGLLRFTSRLPHRPFHRFQPIYAAFLYSLFSLDYVFVRDLVDFFNADIIRPSQRRRRRLAALVGGKILYLAGMIGIPIVYLHYPAGAVLLGFLLMHFVIGFWVAAVFAPTHILDCNRFPLSRSEFPDYTHHIFATTCDFATESRLVTWLTGGLNHHIVHHIVPDVCHVHYPALTRIAKLTAAEFNIPYNEIPSMRGALLSHHAMLRQLARAA